MFQLDRRSLLAAMLGAGLSPWRDASAAALPKDPLLGVNLGNHGPLAIEQYEAWLGRKVDFVQVHTGRRGWSDYIASIRFGGNLYDNSRTIHWSMPLFIEGGSLAAAAAGDYDRYWRRAIRIVLSYSGGSDPIYLRSGWEFNIRGQPWFSGGNEALFVQALRRYVAIMRSISQRFRFVWCPNYDVKGLDTELSYPGDAYVDVISMDFYVYRGFTAMPPSEAWIFYRDAAGGYGLTWLVRFAAAHGKPVAIDEWGVMFDGYGEFIASAAAFFRQNDFFYTAYWEETSAYNAKLSDDHLPATAARFVAEFGGRSAAE